MLKVIEYAKFNIDYKKIFNNNLQYYYYIYYFNI